MVKRCIGIDIGSSCLCAVQIVRTDGEFRIEKVFDAQIRRKTDSPEEMLKPLFSRHGFDKRAEVAVSMQHEGVFFRNLQTDSAAIEHVRQQNWAALKHNFPIEAEEIVAQAYSCRPLDDDKYSVLTVASTRQSLQKRLKVFAAAKIRPALADAPIFAIHSTLLFNHPEIVNGRAVIAYLDDHYLTLALTQDSEIAAVRSIPVITDTAGDDVESARRQMAGVISRETRLTWRKVFAADIRPQTKIYLTAAAQTSQNMAGLTEEELKLQTVVVDCFAAIENLPAPQPRVPICVAEGLALRLLAPEQTRGVNFLRAGKSHSQPPVNLKREFVTCTALICAIAVFSLVGLFMRLSRLETAYARIKTETDRIFRAALPQDKNVNPLVQLQQKLEALRKNPRKSAYLSRSGLSPMDILYKLSINSAPHEKIRVNNILIAADTVRINGTCDSFEPVYSWQRALQKVPAFANTEFRDIARESGGGLVEFTMLLSLSVQESI
jgi:Tfp pilus assembly protein PilN